MSNWWKTGVVYQIYPKSFLDTTGSGTGDLQGIIARLDYLQDLGISAIWLTPIYVSPQVDNGYDIADYYNIDPSYGSMDDFEQLVEQAHRRGIKIIMDMVFNHTSTDHPWFIQAQDPASPYHDYYIWRPEPNNWQSKFGGSAWEWNEQAQKYYLHLFAREQADLNWENPKVRAEIYKVCNFWAQKGVDGLRLDVINLISKDQSFADDHQGDGRVFYTDGPRVHEFLQELNREVLVPCQLMTVGEMSSTTLENCRKYANLEGTELSMTFNFHHLKVDYPQGQKWTFAQPDFVELKRIINYWQQGMHNQAWNALFWCNHDQPRVVSRFGNTTTPELLQTSAKLWAMILHGLQGTPYIYQGEEIGMTNALFTSLEQYRDIESLNMYEIMLEQGYEHELIMQILGQKSRDNGRTPIPWNAQEHGGFTQGTPWIPLASNYHELNVAQALAQKDSVFYTYKALIALRQENEVFVYGDYQDLDLENPQVWSYLRKYQGKTLWVVANLSDKLQIVDLPEGLEHQELDTYLLLNNLEWVNVTNEDTVYLQPYQALYYLF
ncbi:alpha,alpha-phosphotrehalase [Psittacicella gerlachiana]|uniref:Alpha,alpha-phosphotrehalase n=1 Tax=Psittacicella gerlachiana TaxID=2028574 RepID=A0A3A1YC20_9GAMM|nr:alpha,alpha-phosphotrehalase [Psittacicella gerlachiana]RIY34759.1 alpha,alpha-phosphotrehalase [Psittacicella gerlachiana]